MLYVTCIVTNVTFIQFYHMIKCGGVYMILNGIDVSEWQGLINWNTVNTDFCIIRAGYGRSVLQKDKNFEINYSGCKNNAIPCGAYWYSYATTKDDALLEAKACIEAIRNKKFEFPIYYDVEEQRQFSLGKGKVSEIIRTFMDILENAGYWTGLYMSSYYLTNYVDDDIKNRYAIWVANYNVSKPSYNGAYGIWQKSSTGRITGINGDVDLNECYIDYPREIKKAGLNGYEKTESKYVKLTIDDVTYSGELMISED